MFKLGLLLSGLFQLITQSQGINSIQPLATAQTIVTDQRLSGTWQDGTATITIELVKDSKLLKPDDKDSGTLGLGDTKEEIAFYSKAYLIQVEQPDRDYVLVGSLSNIKGQLYMDIMSLGLGKKNNPNNKGTDLEFSPYYLATYNIARVNFDANGRLSLGFLRGDFIKEQVLGGQMMLKHAYEPLFDNFLITASSFEWSQFLGKYGHDSRIFGSQFIRLTRKE